MGRIRLNKTYVVREKYLGIIILFSSLFASHLSAQTKVAPIIHNYENFESDLNEILSSPNPLFVVDVLRRPNQINSLKRFSQDLGIDISETISTQKDFSFFKKNSTGSVDASFHYFSSEENLRLSPDTDLVRLSESNDSESAIMVRESFLKFSGSSSALSESLVYRISDKKLIELGLNFNNDIEDESSTVYQDRLVRAKASAVRGVNDGEDRFLRQDAGYYRTINGRQVVNSLVKTFIDPSRSQVRGISVQNMWPLSEVTEDFEIKSKDEIVNEIEDLVYKRFQETSGLTINILDCEATYFSFFYTVAPTISCTVKTDSAGEILSNYPFYIHISLTKDKFPEIGLDDRVFDPDLLAILDGSDALPSDEGEVSGSSFGTYYTTADETFYLTAAKFNDKFSDHWSNADGPRYYRSGRFRPDDSYEYADNVDLVFGMTHGAIHLLDAEYDKNVFLFNTEYFIASAEHFKPAQLGLKDAEYFSTFSCQAASAVSCMGRSGTQRFTDTTGTSDEDMDTIFSGLHIFSSSNGDSFASNSSAKKLARLYAKYLADDIKLIEAWQNAFDDSDSWDNNAEDGCMELTNALNDCTTYRNFDCPRYTRYASSYYQDGKRNVNLGNRGSYSTDYRAGDAGYDIDLIYQYQSSSIPISSKGYTLP